MSDLGRNGMDHLDMGGMLLKPIEARMRMCVLQVGKRGRWKYRDWIRWQFLWKFFPWYARELHYRGSFCMGPSCMYWGWEDSATKERGYCSVVLKPGSLSDVTRVPAADRYVSTADNQEVFASLADKLGTVRDELVRDQNSGELPFPVQENRGMVEVLNGLLAQIKEGGVLLSDLTQKAMPLVRKIIEGCKGFHTIYTAAHDIYKIIVEFLSWFN